MLYPHQSHRSDGERGSWPRGSEDFFFVKSQKAQESHKRVWLKSRFSARTHWKPAENSSKKIEDQSAARVSTPSGFVFESKNTVPTEQQSLEKNENLGVDKWGSNTMAQLVSGCATMKKRARSPVFGEALVAENTLVPPTPSPIKRLGRHMKRVSSHPSLDVVASSKTLTVGVGFGTKITPSLHCKLTCRRTQHVLR